MNNLDSYILSHIDEEGEYLHRLWRDTQLKLSYGQMASGHLQGRLLKMLVQMIRPQRVLELGMFSGYSALSMAEGLTEGAELHTFEVFDEMEDFARPWIEGSPYGHFVHIHIGDPPVIMIGRMPAERHSSIAGFTSGRTGSIMPTMPTKQRSHSTASDS